MKLIVYGNLVPVATFDNPAGFDLDGFPSDSVAAQVEPCDNAVVVVTPTALFINFDSRWFKYRSPVAPTVEAVNAALASITSDPEAYLDDERCDEDEDWADAEHERVMGSFGWEPSEPE